MISPALDPLLVVLPANLPVPVDSGAQPPKLGREGSIPSGEAT